MSKYIDELTELICDTVRTVFPNASLDDGYDVADEVIAKLPTIEVSEDCVSKHDIWKIIEDNAYWVRCNENSTEKGMTLTGINQALNECPPVIPTERTGEWIADDGDATCSHCQRLFKGTKYDRMYNEKFCPNCGARME